MNHRLSDHRVMQSVRNALAQDRNATEVAGQLKNPPKPPELDDALIRLVRASLLREELIELFMTRAKENKMYVQRIGKQQTNQLGKIIAEIMVSAGASNAGVCESDLWEKLGMHGGLVQTLAASGLDVISGSNITLDSSYDLDAGVTDCFAAVAETGTVAVMGRQGHGRALSLVPNLHIVVVEADQILPDLSDLMIKPEVAQARAMTLITGPSKTADIEMNLVVGVHGPGVVHVLVLA